MKRAFSKKRKNRFSQNGFTLIETLVAISIIMVGITAAFSVAQIGVSSSSFAKERITGFFLAQEAFEAVKNRRDINLLKNNASAGSAYWLEGLTRAPGGGGPGSGPCPDSPTVLPCDYDIKNNAFNTCENLNGCNLQNLSLAGVSEIKYYGYTPEAPNSKFKREIRIEEITPNDEAKVTVKIMWGSHTLEITDNILNWF